MVPLLEETLGEPVEIVPYPLAKFYASGTLSGSEELWRNMRWCYENTPDKNPDARNVELSLTLLPNAQKAKDFIQRGGKSLVKDF